MRAIAYDRRGFGRSDQPWAGYDYNTLADDLAAVLEDTQAQDATLIGFSMGGGEVARYMSRHAGRGVSSAILIGSVVPYMLKTADNPDGVDQSIFDGAAAGIAADRAKFWAGFFKSFYGVGMLAQPVSDEVVEWSCDLAMRASLKATLDCATAFSSTDFRADLPAFRVPTLVIHGTGDQTVPIAASARKAAKGIAGSTSDRVRRRAARAPRLTQGPDRQGCVGVYQPHEPARLFTIPAPLAATRRRSAGRRAGRRTVRCCPAPRSAARSSPRSAGCATTA